MLSLLVAAESLSPNVPGTEGTAISAPTRSLPHPQLSWDRLWEVP